MYASIAGVHRSAAAPRSHHGARLAAWGALEPRLPDPHQEGPSSCLLRQLLLDNANDNCYLTIATCYLLLENC